jgi:glycosyltransferase involved in cell wall biosynthesis
MTCPVPADPPRRRVLLSAFACAPDWGSEPGVGWQWALALSQRHDVTVVTHERFRSRIEHHLAHCPRPGLTFSFHGRAAAEPVMQRQVDSRLHYWRWQLGLRRHVKRLLARQPHDLVHHLTWGSFKLPSFLGGLGPPFVFGPAGGGERAPARLRRSWPWRERAFYGLRELGIAAAGVDPFVRATLRSACCLLMRNDATIAALPACVRQRATLATEIGIAPAAIVAGRVPELRPGQPLRLLYAGRLIGGKGAGYAVAAALQARQQGVALVLRLAGEGGMEPFLRQQVQAAEAQDGVRFLGLWPHAGMNALYDNSDLLLFPSWHDSSGTVVTEALARGLPVLCLDLGGPRHVADGASSVVVATAGLDEAGLVRAIAALIAELANDRGRLARLSEGALQRAHALTWARQVDRAYARIERQLGWAPQTVDAAPP